MSEPITKGLREWASKHFGKTLDDGRTLDDGNTLINGGELLEMNELLEIADRIDAEHERRMENCRRVGKRLIIRYMRGVLNDYDRNIKRVRKGDATEVVRCEDCMYAYEQDGRYVCSVRPSIAHYVDGSDYCSRGVRVEVDE